MSFPFENNTSAAVNNLAQRSLKARKNTVAILAILLSALLFTGLFTVVVNLTAAVEQNDMRYMGGYAHAGLKRATLEEYEELAGDSRWTGSGYSVFIGKAVGEAFAKLNAEVRWADDFYAETVFCPPTEGHMPEAEDELAASRLVLKALGVPDQLGTEVPLSFETDTETVTGTFTLCGVWDGDPAAGAQMLWLSRRYADQAAPARHGSSSEAPEGEYSGTVYASFMLPSSWQLEDRAYQIFSDHGLAGEFQADGRAAGAGPGPAGAGGGLAADLQHLRHLHRPGYPLLRPAEGHRRQLRAAAEPGIQKSPAAVRRGHPPGPGPGLSPYTARTRSFSWPGPCSPC